MFTFQAPLASQTHTLNARSCLQMLTDVTKWPTLGIVYAENSHNFGTTQLISNIYFWVSSNPLRSIPGCIGAADPRGTHLSAILLWDCQTTITEE